MGCSAASRCSLRPVIRLGQHRRIWSSAVQRVRAQPVAVADITFVRTWQGFCYTAFVTDVCTKAIKGWAVAASMRTEDLPLRAINHAVWQADPDLCEFVQIPLAAAVRMVDDTGFIRGVHGEGIGVTMVHRHLQRCQHQLRAQRLAHHPARHAATETSSTIAR